ncbi:MAG: hypothetical protein OXI88_01000 [Gammaproteobacteria bacterium]|nr:hypothetical protein [Gammaproteobacteria bacterium]
MSKYAPLTGYLSSSGMDYILMTFAEVEDVIGDKLPRSAFEYRPWWSNNPSNHVNAYSWLRAGYKTADVDMVERKLAFRKASADELPVGRNNKTSKDEGASPYSRIFGALKGTVTIAPGVDLTLPTGEKWNAEQ